MDSHPASSSPPPDEPLRRAALHFVAAFAALWLTGSLAGSPLRVSDDVLRLAYAQGTADGYWLFPPGTAWLPAPSLWQALFLLVLPWAPPLVAIRLASTVALAGALVLLGRTARRLAPTFGRPVVAAVFLLSPTIHHLGISALSEAFTILIAAAVAELLSSDARRRPGGFPLLILLLGCLQACRFETWPATLLAGAWVLKDAWQGAPGPSRAAAAAGFVALGAVPLAWFLPDFLRSGDLFAILRRVDEIHRDSSQRLSLSARLLRLGTEGDPIHLLALAAAIGGVAAALRRGLAAQVAAVGLVPGILAAVLLATALRGTFTYLPLDRFVAVPAVLWAPLAAIMAEALAARAGRRAAAAALALVLAAALAITPERPERYPRRLLREELARQTATTCLALHPDRPVRETALHLWPRGSAELLPVTFAALYPGQSISSRPLSAREDSWVRQRHFAHEMGYQVLVIYGTMATAREARGDKDWGVAATTEGHLVLIRRGKKPAED